MPRPHPAQRRASAPDPRCRRFQTVVAGKNDRLASAAFEGCQRGQLGACGLFVAIELIECRLDVGGGNIASCRVGDLAGRDLIAADGIAAAADVLAISVDRDVGRSACAVGGTADDRQGCCIGQHGTGDTASGDGERVVIEGEACPRLIGAGLGAEQIALGAVLAAAEFVGADEIPDGAIGGIDRIFREHRHTHAIAAIDDQGASSIEPDTAADRLAREEAQEGLVRACALDDIEIDVAAVFETVAQPLGGQDRVTD